MASLDVQNDVIGGGKGEGEFAIELEAFNDGHFPGGTELETKIAQYHNRNSTATLSSFDNILEESWCSRAYEYGVEHRKPWGT
ncbi:hypothetical protein EON63_08075 [archaeon]|nr:MAG: hypothetical protein EON63_08075 [archaeon]